MLLALIVISVSVIVFTHIILRISKKYINEDYVFAIEIIALFIAVISGFLAIFVVADIIREPSIDKKIQSYEAENAVIESKIDLITKYYFEEQDIENIPEEITDSIILVSLIPELRSDEMISHYISIYVENLNQIRELQNQKDSVKESKQFLYFGT